MCVPLLILGGILSTWEKDVCEGSTPVLPIGTTTSMGATRPTRAGAPTLYLATSSLTCFNKGIRLRKAWFAVFSACILIDLFVIVFLPIKTTESPRRPFRMFWSWFKPTLSAAAIKIWVYSSKS
ncbi:hypothetical protein E1A91_A03G196100v1 [Gossypium mustelinum]|uniref:PGG domain-containing protein n=2 Tax=Gossypium TaxID=3633 RepID=A0A5D2ZYZ9_GOSMU|nr:hypothetical protein ES332_A03G212500v1 [Gossypium tomentosum]TYJ44068.1 hypothetical protein E1A91_A03G196100v1 [Gossypium mustelinum]